MRKTKLATCPHCGVPIYYSRKGDDGLPIPEYVCDCRLWARVTIPQIVTVPDTNPLPANPYPWIPVYGESSARDPLPWETSKTYCDVPYSATTYIDAVSGEKPQGWLVG